MRSYSGWTGPSCPAVALHDLRATNLNRLLQDFARPSLCVVLGAGASYGVMPISKDEVVKAIRELHYAKGDAKVLPLAMQELLTDPTLKFVMAMLPHAGERFLDEAWPTIELSLRSRREERTLDSAHASVIINEVFTPRGDVPPELSEIYFALESTAGTIVTYNYDRIEGSQSGFQVIAPHGQRSEYTQNLTTWKYVERLARYSGIPVPNDLHLPVPEHDGVRDRPAYQKMLRAFASAHAIVLVGYAFGNGDDAMSFEDFGRVVGPSTAVHVVNPDTKEVCKQVGYPLKWRERNGGIIGHNFRWRQLAAAILHLLDRLRRRHVWYAIGHEQEICDLHDRGCPPRTARRLPRVGINSEQPYDYRRDIYRTGNGRAREEDEDEDVRFYRSRVAAFQARRRAEQED